MRIIGHRTIGAENAAVGNVHQAHAVPVGTVGIQGLQIGLRTAVILEIGDHHIGIAGGQVVVNGAEVLAVPAALQHA